MVYRSRDEGYDFFLAILLDACRLSLGEELGPRRVRMQRSRQSCGDRYEAAQPESEYPADQTVRW